MKTPDILNNRHLSTILPIYLAQALEPNYARERIYTPDNDFIDLDWVNMEVTDKPTLILFHGTEGSSKSHYAKRIMCYLEQIGWRGVVPHFRSCSEEINCKPRFYHAGETEDLALIVDTIKARTQNSLFAAGVSLGGNALLKYLGEHVNNSLDAAIGISVPFDLIECITALDNDIFNRNVYVRHFLSSVIPKMKEYAKKFSNFEYKDKKIETMDEFNNLYICQAFNFKNSQDYYEKASCKPFLKNIQTHTLILQARNDPMIPVSSWPDKKDLSPFIRFVGTRNGGHAGFLSMSKNYKESLLRLPKFMVEFLEQHHHKENIAADVKVTLQII